MIYVAILGHGVVGSGVAEVLHKNAASIGRKAGSDIAIRRILDLRDFPDCPYADLFTKDFQDILQDKEIRIVVETMGGLNPAYDYVKSCLLAGKSVVTSNKELVAAKGQELLAIARDKGCNFLFEASVGGGIPIIRPLHQCLAANDIDEIVGILNGTTNFILTKMIHENMSFEDALSLAQKLGYAERDPSADVDGHDACRKICILASLAFGRHVYPEQVKTEGIRKIQSADVAYAAAWGGAIKLIGTVKKLESGKLSIYVTPALIPGSSQLCTVDDVFNGIMVRGDAIGDVVFYGKGAGKLPTASAVVADVIDAVRHLNSSKSIYWEDSAPGYIEEYENSISGMYVRAAALEGSYERQVREAFPSARFITREGAPENEFAFVTGEMPLWQFRRDLCRLGETIRVENALRIADC